MPGAENTCVFPGVGACEVRGQERKRSLCLRGTSWKRWDFSPTLKHKGEKENIASSVQHGLMHYSEAESSVPGDVGWAGDTARTPTRLARQ